jgi:hypothetical protein
VLQFLRAGRSTSLGDATVEASPPPQAESPGIAAYRPIETDTCLRYLSQAVTALGNMAHAPSGYLTPLLYHY